MRQLVLGAIVLSGCARPLPDAPMPTRAGPAGTLTVQLFSSIDWPFRVERTALAIDGALAPFDAHVPAAEGPHTVSFAAVVSIPCGAMSSKRMKLRVVSSRFLGVGSTGTSIAISLSALSDPTLPWPDRLRVLWNARGETAFTSRPPTPQHCASLDTPHRAVCVVESRVEEARKQRDVIRLTCERDHLLKMQALLPSAASGDATARKRIEQLELEAEQCVGEDLLYVESQNVTSDDECGPELDER